MILGCVFRKVYITWKGFGKNIKENDAVILNAIKGLIVKGEKEILEVLI